MRGGVLVNDRFALEKCHARGVQVVTGMLKRLPMRVTEDLASTVYSRGCIRSTVSSVIELPRAAYRKIKQNLW